jgi:hypothetical protein
MDFDAVLTLIEAKRSECEDMRPYKVFPTPFYSPLSPDRLRGTTWQDFLQAMAATGLQFEKLCESVWQFTPINLDANRGKVSTSPIRKREYHTALQGDTEDDRGGCVDEARNTFD